MKKRLTKKELDELEYESVVRENRLWDDVTDEFYGLIESQLISKSSEIQMKESELMNLTDEMNKLTKLQQTFKEIVATRNEFLTLKAKNEQRKTKAKNK